MSVEHGRVNIVLYVKVYSILNRIENSSPFTLAIFFKALFWPDNWNKYIMEEMKTLCLLKYIVMNLLHHRNCPIKL